LKKLKSSRKLSFLIILIIYISAILAGVYVFNYFSNYNILFRILLADIAGTLVVWIFGIVFKNSSVYDPYWSVAPVVIMFLYAFYTGNSFSTGTYAVLFAVSAWGIRLTLNWAYTFDNLNIQDWRYDYYKSAYPSLWHLINLTGINLMPTLIVFGSMIPGLLIIQNNFDANMLTYLFVLICLFAVIMQTTADLQIHQFKKTGKAKGAICKKGLWGFCRHPNYTGEIVMWWGVFGMLLSISFSYYIYGLGAIFNTLMFIFISVPLMENKLIKNKVGYKDYIDSVSMFFPSTKVIIGKSQIIEKLFSDMFGRG